MTSSSLSGTERQGNTVESIKERVDALKGLWQIDVAVEFYCKLFGTVPACVNEVVRLSELETILANPLVGRYIIDTEGRVRSEKGM